MEPLKILDQNRFSSKQIAFVEFLIGKLGFKKDQFTNDYLGQLVDSAYKFKSCRLVEKRDEDSHSHSIEDNQRRLPLRYTIVDFLVDEYNLKKNRNYKTNNTIAAHMSATDLSNFTYCPVSYSLSKTFQIPPLISAESGKALHEDARLIRIKNSLNKILLDTTQETDSESFQREDITDIITNENKSFFEDIETAKIIFSGHTSDNTGSYFFNEKRNFYGQPDYIFENKSGSRFVVEEKYKTTTARSHRAFHLNHEIQLASYIYYLNELKIDYGYLVYWIKYRRWDVENQQYTSEKFCHVKRINRNETVEKHLEDAYQRVKSFSEKKSLKVDTENINPAKCASCVTSMYCGHKTKRIKHVSLPYSKNHHALYYAPFPEILKKSEPDSAKESGLNSKHPK